MKPESQRFSVGVPDTLSPMEGMIVNLSEHDVAAVEKIGATFSFVVAVVFWLATSTSSDLVVFLGSGMVAFLVIVVYDSIRRGKRSRRVKR